MELSALNTAAPAFTYRCLGSLENYLRMDYTYNETGMLFTT